MIQAKLFKPEVGERTGGVKIPVGIHKGTVKFEGVTQESGWADIKFSNNNGQVIHKRLFEPTGNKPLENESPQAALDREIDRNARTLVHVMEALLGNEVVENYFAPDYKSFLTGAAMLLNAKKGVAVNLKVVPDWREKTYPDLPRKGFVELYVEGQEPTLAYTALEQKDLLTLAENREKTQGTATSEDPVF